MSPILGDFEGDVYPTAHDWKGVRVLVDDVSKLMGECNTLSYP